MSLRYTNVDVMAEIKSATRTQHESLERCAGILERVRTAEGYANTIATLSMLHDLYEPRIALHDCAFREIGLSIDRRSRRELLDVDRITIRECFSIETPLHGHTGLPYFCIDTFAQALGWLYVFEGSTLGGTIIAQHVHRVLAIPTSYYGAYGSECASMWSEFRAAVATYVERNESELPAIIAGARTAFTIVAAAFVNANANPDGGAPISG